MKSMAMLVAAVAAVLAVNFSDARSQEACSKDYVACMTHCAGRPAKGLQDMCMNTCQLKNNQCAEKIYGSRREVDPPNKPQADGDKALAKEVAPAPPPRKVDVAPRKSERPSLRKVEGPSLRKVDAPQPEPEPQK
jgi:hypothetical protein